MNDLQRLRAERNFLLDALQSLYHQLNGVVLTNGEGGEEYVKPYLTEFQAKKAGLHQEQRDNPYDSLATPEEIDEARQKYGNGDIEIDDGAKVSRLEGEGTWVAAWVWLPRHDAG